MSENLASGTLIYNKGTVSIEILNYSSYVLHIRIFNDKNLSVNKNSDGVIINLNNNSFALGACKYISSKRLKENEGYLVFLEDQYDFHELFKNEKIRLQETSFFSLSIIIAQKEKVRTTFKSYSSELVFELMVYKQFFDKLDENFSNEPPSVRNQLQKVILEKEGREFLEFFNHKIELLKEETQDMDSEENSIHGFFFRKQLWGFITQSQFMLRTNTKPRGYAGDYIMMQMIYSNNYMGNSIFSKLFHKFPVETLAAQAVRNRNRIISQKIQEICCNSFPSREDKIKILSVACGSGNELNKIFLDDSSFEKYKFTFLDQDKDALEAARETVNSIEGRFGNKLDIEYLNESVRTLLRHRDSSYYPDWGTFDIIYSMGLFDYLTPPVARVVFAKLFTMLEPGGSLLIGNFHSGSPDKEFLEYWLDWVLYYRSEEEMLELTDNLNIKTKNLFFEETKSQLFLEVSKN